MVLFHFNYCNKSYPVHTPPALISFAICRWCDICIFNVRNKDVVVVVVVVMIGSRTFSVRLFCLLLGLLLT